MNGISPVTLLGLAFGSASTIVLAAWLMLKMSKRDLLLAGRINAAQGRWPTGNAPQSADHGGLFGSLQQALAALGGVLLSSGLVRGRTRHDLEQTLAASGFRSRNALPLFLGGKVVLVVASPAAAWVVAGALGFHSTTRLLILAAGFVAGLLTPDRIVSSIRKRYLGRLEDGLPDALDLLVVCAQAGLSLAPAMIRVAAEMRMGRPEVAREFEQTVRELEIMADAQVALNNLARRTGLETLQRLVSTLVQTLQYGTPLTEALRTLSADIRQQALNRFEARAARLPVLLTLPMILFILPCVFIVVGGPAVIQIMKTFGH